MAHPKQIDSADVLQTALDVLERKGRDKVSLRGIAVLLGVKAPSLYRYFSEKSALERAMVEEGMRLLMKSLSEGRGGEAEARFRNLGKAYLSFARQRPALYACIMEDGTSAAYSSPAGKEVWGVLLSAIGGLSGEPDDTAGAVATWAFLHGFAVLERSKAFGKSGPKQGFETGLGALLLYFRRRHEQGHS